MTVQDEICKYCSKPIKEQYHWHKRHQAQVKPGLFKKGRIPWNKGKTKEELNANYKKGWKSPFPRYGQDNYNWKGGKTPEIIRLRMSNKYKEWRTSVFKRDDYTCKMCGYDKGHIIEANHIIPLRLDLTKIFEVSNGITLCEDCHKTVFFKEEQYIDIFNDLLVGVV